MVIDHLTEGCLGGFAAAGTTCRFALPGHQCESTTCTAGEWEPPHPRCIKRAATRAPTPPAVGHRTKPPTEPPTARPLDLSSRPALTRKGPAAVNLGLPRTGTFSLHFAALELNLTSRHIAGQLQTESAGNKALLELLLSGVGGSKYIESLLETDVVGDTPFYLQGTKQALLKHYPNSRMFCTKSSRDRWISSVIKHGTAGARSICWIASARCLLFVY